MPLTLRAHAGSALAALLAACSTAAPPKAPAPPPTLAQPGARALTVTEANSGATITLDTTQALRVRLPVNATTGFEWSLVDLKPGVLNASTPTFERALRNTNVEEVLGTTVWQLEPRAAGAVTLHFELRRPRSLLPATQTVSYNVVVR